LIENRRKRMTIAPAPSQETIDQFVGNAHGNITVVRELLDKYPSIINANASWAETAVQAAAQTGQVEIVNILVDHGADPNPKYEGKTPLAMALEKAQDQLVAVLCSYGGKE
jgi:ankyrin repeat protein